MAFPRIDDVRTYTVDMEEWLIAYLIIEPERYPEVRHLVSPSDFWRPLSRVFLQAIDNLFAAHGPEGVHPVGIAHEVFRLTSSRGPAPLTIKEAGAYMAEALSSFPPLTGGHLTWAAKEMHRLAEEREGAAPRKKRATLLL